MIPSFETFTLEGFFKLNGSLLDKFREFNPSLRISLDNHAFELSRNENGYALVKTFSEFNHLLKNLLCESNMFNKVYKQFVEHLAFKFSTSSIMRLFYPMSVQKGIGAKEKHECFGEWTIKEKPPDLLWRHFIYKDFKQGTMSRAEHRNVEVSSIFKDEPPDVIYKSKEDELITKKGMIQEEPPDPIPLTFMISSFKHIKDFIQVSNSLSRFVSHDLKAGNMSLFYPKIIEKKLGLFEGKLKQNSYLNMLEEELDDKEHYLDRNEIYFLVYRDSMTVIIHLLFARCVDYIAGVKEEPPDLEDLLSTFFARTGIGFDLTKELCQRYVLVKRVLNLEVLSKALKESYQDVEPHLEFHNNHAQPSILRGEHSPTLFFNDSNLLLFVAGKTDLRTNLFQVGGDDMIMGRHVPELETTDAMDKSQGEKEEPSEEMDEEKQGIWELSEGPLTRVKSKRLKGAISTLLKEAHGNSSGYANPTSLVVN